MCRRPKHGKDIGSPYRFGLNPSIASKHGREGGVVHELFFIDAEAFIVEAIGVSVLEPSAGKNYPDIHRGCGSRSLDSDRAPLDIIDRDLEFTRGEFTLKSLISPVGAM